MLPAVLVLASITLTNGWLSFMIVFTTFGLVPLGREAFRLRSRCRAHTHSSATRE